MGGDGAKEEGGGDTSVGRGQASQDFLLFVRSLWAAHGLIWHCLRHGGQRGAVALAGQQPPGLVSHLCGHPHLKAVGTDGGKLLPVSAEPCFGQTHQGRG